MPRLPLLTALAVALATAAALTAADGTARASGPARPERRASPTPIATADQATRSVHVLKASQRTWDTGDPRGGGVLWSWSADGLEELADLNPASSWKNPSEAKLRTLDGRRYLLATASGGLAAVVGYPGREIYWAADTGTGNAHSIDLLPDGNVAVAASTGGYVRVYAASTGKRATWHTEVPLPGAHGVHWDPGTGLLWALGGRELLALRVGGPPDDPELTVAHRTALPTRNGHDLAPVLGHRGRLWVTTGSAVYQYATARHGFVDYPLRSRISAPGVKSVGDDPATGQILVARPETGHPCPWCTSVLTLYQPDGTRRLLHGAMYKARWWTSRRD
ncbi:DUF6528 family protein [Streptomyces caatingaensis]|uniref:WD40 repeat domain-containing protein n=1 Tax=Streptomyces caatingaensis TaxID=1678637 RepID=A0A0K9XI38_9ACTN|nr:DUF6528 family protein [Streptomyces caatingaensis]KNB52327.1 hypothetical protein AC230_12365 [Streptomyces caatingaensis]